MKRLFSFPASPNSRCYRNCCRTSSFMLRKGVYSTPERRVEPSGGVFLHRRRDAAIKVERGTDRRMPEPLLRDLQVHPGEQVLSRNGCGGGHGTESVKSRIRARARNLGNSYVRLCGCRGSPSRRAQTSVSPVCRTSSMRRTIACSALPAATPRRQSLERIRRTEKDLGQQIRLAQRPQTGDSRAGRIRWATMPNPCLLS